MCKSLNLLRQRERIRVICAIAFLAGNMSWGFGQEQSNERLSDDVTHSEVAHLLQMHCVNCHGVDEQSGGLRLDTKEFVEQGGDSGLPIFGGTTQTNEILRRITSKDDAYRMPKAAAALSPEQIDIVRQWVEAGTPLGGSAFTHEHSVTKSQSWLFDQLSLAADFHSDVKRWNPYLNFLTYLFLAGNVAIWWAERGKRTTANHCVTRTIVPSLLQRLRSGLHIWHYATFYTIVFGALGVTTAFGAWVEQTELNVELRQRLKKARRTGSMVVGYFGDPPIPFRPKHPAALSHTYYRGNCERSKKLFNGGNYRTAVLRVSLRDGDSGLMKYGDSLPDDGIGLRFEIERAPGTTPEMFTSSTMNSLFLSEHYYASGAKDSPSRIGDTPRYLEVVAAGQRWQIDFPLLAGPTKSSCSGLIYVYKGQVQEDNVTATAHYGIHYDLEVVNGRISKGSEIWLGCLFLSSVVAKPQPDKVPFAEWFDHHPIPEITGTNSKDPVLLGLPSPRK